MKFTEKQVAQISRPNLNYLNTVSACLLVCVPT